MSSFLRALAAILVALGAAIATPSNVFAAVPVYNDVVVDVRSGTDFSTRRDGMTRALEEAAPPPLAPPQLTLAGTTTARAATFTYDGPSPTRVGIHVDGAASAVPALLNGQREESASFTVTDRSMATTRVARSVATNSVEMPGTIYRGGGSSPSNLKMRPGEDALSFRDSLSNPLQPGSPVLHPGRDYIGIDTSKLPPGSVVPDGVPGSALTPPGHVSVYVTDPDVLKAAIIEKGKFPK